VRAPEILEALAPVSKALEALGIGHYVGGSVASSAHGVPRASLDVDLLAELRPEHVPAFCHRLGDAYYLDASRIRDAVARQRSFNLIHLATMLKVDVFVSTGRPFDREAISRTRPEQFGEGGEAQAFPLASAEDTVLVKLEWYRKGGEVSERQWNDVLGILRVLGARLDGTYLDRWAASLAVTDLLERARRDAGSAP
jgi:hypothetical protein